MAKALVVISAIPAIPFMIYGGIVILGATFRGVGPTPWYPLLAYLFGIVGLMALVASPFTRFTISAKSRMVILAGLVSGILSVIAALYFAIELLASSRGALVYFVLLCSLICPVAAAIVSIGGLVRVPQS